MVQTQSAQWMHSPEWNSSMDHQTDLRVETLANHNGASLPGAESCKAWVGWRLARSDALASAK